MELAFHKYEGLGNDFIVLDRGRGVTREQAVALCDRHLGVGADGVLMVGVEAGRATMRVVNADGSTSEMCGNGLRCVALHLVRTKVITSGSFDVDTDAGPHGCRVMGDRVEVEMAIPSLLPADLPVKADAPLVDAPFDVDGRTVRDHGGVDGQSARGHVRRRGRVAPDARASDRVRPAVPCARERRLRAGRRRCDRAPRLRAGVGWTRACGTGACAAAVAAVETGRRPRGVPVRVRLPGGELDVVVRAPGEKVSMTGPARFVFEGRAVVDAT